MGEEDRMKSFAKVAVVLAVALWAGPGYAQQQLRPGAPAPTGEGNSEGAPYRLFQYHCMSCHGKVEEAPPVDILKKLTPERIYEVLTTGNMRTQAAHLSDEQKVQIAEAVGGRKMGLTESGDVQQMSNVCATHPPVADPATVPSWNGWSPDPLRNTRFQPASAARLSPAAVSRLQLKWAFGLPLTTSMYGQPVVVGDRVFIGSDSGYLYSLDAASGCAHWSFRARAGLRSTPMIAPIRPGSSQMAAYFGDIRGNVYAVDASNGELLWEKPVDPHPLSRITAGVKVYGGRVYVSVASLEEPESGSFTYKCCTFRGMVAVLDAATGKQIWKTYTLPEPATSRKTSSGIPFLGPAGAGVWGTVAIDTKRKAVYFSTGNMFSAPDVGRSDAVMAADMDTGKVLWVKQTIKNDVRSSGNCRQLQGNIPSAAGFPPRSASRRPNPNAAPPPPRKPRTREELGFPADYYCPEEQENPDWDFSAGVMLVDLPNGKSLVVAGQKGGMVWAFDPDRNGELVWGADISRGDILFGAASDGEQGYFAMRGGALAGVRLQDGLEQWGMWIDPQPAMERHRGISAAVSAIPGVVFTAGLDGMLRAFSSFDGRPLWQYDTTQEFKTVNGVKAKGGSMGSGGAVVANGMLFVASGYIGFQGGQPGNVLLAFGPPED
jgi:polyvinyl alcohol dehydrogenase (cytochrome)